MQEPCPSCATWYDLHAELHAELQCEPWDSPKRAGSSCMNEEIAARMKLLREAAEAGRAS